MAAIAHKQLSKSHGLARSPDSHMRVKSPAAPPPIAVVSQPVESIRAIPRLA